MVSFACSGKKIVREDIRAETIRELEKIVTTSSGSKIFEYDFWKKDDGKQEVKLNLRSLKQIIKGILADLGFRNLQYLWFEYREVSGERIFGPANGAIWWQITVRQIGSGHVLIAIVVFQDGSWVRMNLSCEPLYGKLDGLIWYHFFVFYPSTAADALLLFWQLPCSTFMKAHGSRKERFASGDVCLFIHQRQQKMQGHQKLRFATGSLKCISLAST